MRFYLTTLIAGLVTAAAPTHAQYTGNWTPGDVAKSRLSISSAAPDAEFFQKEMLTRPNGDQRDALLMGGHNPKTPGPIAWINYHTSRLKFSWSGGPMDTLYSLAPPFMNQKARMSPDGRETATLNTALTGGLETVEIVKGVVNFEGADQRECAAWRTQKATVSAAFWGYFCAAPGRSLNVADIQQVMGALTLSE
ncbi:hypothetical protein ACFSM5_08040 [Lacibacterium aquatile]|uniref:Uncharacterized protein n=1 Tax=Lacibacterium aquatile TaxID=1168082 RepID=A0ABW5DPJ3_9PROT